MCGRVGRRGKLCEGRKRVAPAAGGAQASLRPESGVRHRREDGTVQSHPLTRSRTNRLKLQMQGSDDEEKAELVRSNDQDLTLVNLNVLNKESGVPLFTVFHSGYH